MMHFNSEAQFSSLILWQVDLITTFTKLSSLGQQINYEAYTYPAQKIELSKLKL